MRRWIMVWGLMMGCTGDGQPGDTDFWWADGNDFKYDDCFDSVLVGDWAPASRPSETLITFDTDCYFFFGGITGTTASICEGTALYENVTDQSGTVTLRSSGVACATCAYSATPTALTLECGIGGLPSTYVPTGS